MINGDWQFIINRIGQCLSFSSMQFLDYCHAIHLPLYYTSVLYVYLFLSKNHRVFFRVSQNALFSVKYSMTGGKRKLEWRRVRKYIRFLILFSQRSSDFRKFYCTTFLVNLHNFSYFDPTIKSVMFFFTIFSGIIHWLRPWKKSAHAQNAFLVLVYEHCSLE